MNFALKTSMLYFMNFHKGRDLKTSTGHKTLFYNIITNKLRSFFSSMRNFELLNKHYLPKRTAENAAAGVGNLRPAGRIRPAKQNHSDPSPSTNYSNCMVPLVVQGNILWICPPYNFLYCISKRNYIMRNRTVL